MSRSVLSDVMPGVSVVLALALSAIALVSCRNNGTSTPVTPLSPTTVAPAIRFSVSGAVRDDTGRPVADAVVGVGLLYSKLPEMMFFTTTDAAGMFRGMLHDGASHHLSVTKPGFRSFLRDRVVVSGDTVLDDVTLQPAQP